MMYDVYEDIKDKVDFYANIFGYDDYLVTIDCGGRIITELLLYENDELTWLSDWWKGEEVVKLLGFIPISHIKIYCTAVDIGRPVFGPDPVRVHMTAIGKYRLEVLDDGETQLAPL